MLNYGFQLTLLGRCSQQFHLAHCSEAFIGEREHQQFDHHRQRHQRDGEQDARNGHQPVHDPHDDGIEPADIAGDQPDQQRGVAGEAVARYHAHQRHQAGEARELHEGVVVQARQADPVGVAGAAAAVGVAMAPMRRSRPMARRPTPAKAN